MISSLGLVISTCISSGCANIASSNELLKTQEETNEIIEHAKDNFDYSNYDLNYEQGQSLVKQKLYQYSKENNLLTSEELIQLNTEIINDENYYFINDINNIFIKKEIDNDISILDNFKFEENATLNVNNNLNIQNNLVNIDISRLNESGSSVNSNSTQKNYDINFEHKSYNENEIYYSINGKLNNINFLGVYCSKDLFISFYNLVAGWLNNLAINGASQSKGIVNIIWEVIKTLTTYTIVPGTIIASSISKISTYLSSLWSSFVSLFSTGGILGVVVAIIIIFISTSCIGILIAMFIFGYLGTGFAVGFLIHHLLWWEWIYGQYD